MANTTRRRDVAAASIIAVTGLAMTRQAAAAAPVTPDDRAIADLLAKQEITEVLYKYCRSMDRMDEALGRTVFHPDATCDYGKLFNGSAEVFLRQAHEGHARAFISHNHGLANILIHVDGDRATSEAHITGTFRLMKEGRLFTRQSWGRYVDRWEKRSGRWAIKARRYLRTTDEVRPVLDKSVWEPDGRRDVQDESYAAFRAVSAPF